MLPVPGVMVAVGPPMCTFEAVLALLSTPPVQVKSPLTVNSAVAAWAIAPLRSSKSPETVSGLIWTVPG